MAASEAEGARTEWAGYVEYRELRSRGLRQRALQVLGRFVEGAVSWPLSARVAFAMWACTRASGKYDRAALPEPLVRSLIWPTLEEWADAHPSDPTPHYLQGVVPRGSAWNEPEQEEALRRALARDPDHVDARLALADLLTTRIDYAQHELPSGYLGDPVADLASLREIDALIGGLPPSQTEVLDNRRRNFGELATRWISYAEARAALLAALQADSRGAI